jgi:hypothetical protein
MVKKAYKKFLCKQIIKWVSTPPSGKVASFIAKQLKRFKESDIEIHKPNEVLNFLLDLKLKQNKTYRFWLSAPIFNNLKKEFYKNPTISEYKKLQGSLNKLYAEQKLQDWEKEIWKELEKEKKISFKKVLLASLTELGMPLNWKEVNKYKLLTIPDYAWILFTSLYFSRPFARKLRHLHFIWYYRILFTKDPLCFLAKEKLKKVIDLEKI